jgi:hypothetical protein
MVGWVGGTKNGPMASLRRKFAWALAGSLAALALLAVLVAVFMARRWSGFNKEWDAELAKIRDSGQSVCVEDWSWTIAKGDDIVVRVKYTGEPLDLTEDAKWSIFSFSWWSVWHLPRSRRWSFRA